MAMRSCPPSPRSVSFRATDSGISTNSIGSVATDACNSDKLFIFETLPATEPLMYCPSRKQKSSSKIEPSDRSRPLAATNNVPTLTFSSSMRRSDSSTLFAAKFRSSAQMSLSLGVFKERTRRPMLSPDNTVAPGFESTIRF